MEKIYENLVLKKKCVFPQMITRTIKGAYWSPVHAQFKKLKIHALNSVLLNVGKHTLKFSF